MPKARAKVTNIYKIRQYNPGRTELHLALAKDVVEVPQVQRLLFSGADVNATDTYLRTPLHDIADRRLTDSDLHVAEMLLNNGADVNARDRLGRTPLHEVVKKILNEVNFRLAEILLMRGADVNAVDVHNQTPIFLSMYRTNLRVLQLFMSFGADFHVVDTQGCNLLFPAVALSQNLEVVQLLVDLGLDVNHRNDVDSTALHWACETIQSHESVRIIKYLMKKGANANTSNMKIIHKNEVTKDNATPFNNAMVDYCEKKKKILRFLMEHSRIHEDVRVLSFNYKPHQESLWKMILEHLAKLQTLGVPVHRALLDVILNREVYRNYYVQCSEELLRARHTRVHSCRVTFYNLLVDRTREMQSYVASQWLTKELNGWLQKFPIYGASMEENVRRESKRRELIDKSAIALSNCVPALNYFIIKDVIDCVMSKKYFSKFCE